MEKVVNKLRCYMDVGQIILTVIGALVSSGAMFGFIQFMITRKDKKEEKAQSNELGALEDKLKKHLEVTNQGWKETYCDKNSQMIANLAKEVRDGLEEREQKGVERYQEHRESIEELRNAVLKLTEDSAARAKYEKSMGESLMALTHDKLVYLGSVYQKRGAITLREKNNLKLLYAPYHDGLGGNSDGEGYFNFCMNLPVITEEEAMEMDSKKKN